VTSSQLAVRRGAQTPRVANFPPYPLSAAPEVIDLAQHAGLYLDEWQKYVLTHGLGQQIDESWTAPKVGCWVPRQNGKGGIIEALELAWLFLFDEEVIIHSAHQHRTSATAYRRLESIIRRTPDLHALVAQYRQANGEQQIELLDGRLLQYNTRSRTALRGFSAKKVVLDEAQELNEDQMAAILPTVSAMENWQVWFFGTPPDKPDAWVYGLRADGEAKAPRLAWFDWGADLDISNRQHRVRWSDRDLWYATNPALGIRIREDTVEDENKPSGLGEKFPFERLGVWLPSAVAGSVLDLNAWTEMLDPESRRSGDVALAFDVTPMRDHASIGMYGLRDDELEHMQLVDYRDGTEWLVDRLVELKQVLDPICFVVDAKNGGAALLDELATRGIGVPEDPEAPRRGDILLLDTSGVADAVGQYIDGYRRRPARYRHIGQEPLDLAIKNAKPRPIGDAGQIAWGRKITDVDIGPIQVVTEARYGFHSWKDLVTDDYDVLNSVW
jgi:hypothetical protein